MKDTLKQQFLEPSREFTPIPFWFWNDKLTVEEIVRQIGDFDEKGVNGFVIHPRMGIPTDIAYMSDTYLDFVEATVREAARRQMTVILYDEAMYPSGSANGQVVAENAAFASRGLLMKECSPAEPVRLADVMEQGDKLISAQAIRRRPDGTTEADSVVVLKPLDGVVTFQAPDEGNWSVLLFIETFSKGTIRGVHIGQDDGQPNAPASADLLNRAATDAFIRLTHDKYYERLKPFFGNTIQAMFTDEPDILGRRHRKGLRAWTDGFLANCREEGLSEADLPLLWLDDERSSAVRTVFRKAVQRKLTEAYYKPLSEWCAARGIALTGHPAGSDDIGLLEHFQIPGQDVVWRWVAPEDGKAVTGRHSTAGKCSADAARHRGRRRNLNEFLGVCGKGNNWSLTADDMKWYIDWLGVRGVNLFCPHAFYYSVDGPIRYTERPPDVGPNNIWWPHYRLYSDYMKRLSWLMTDSRNVASIAVLCPEDALPWGVVKPLYEGQLEFNYLEERLLASSCELQDGSLRIAGQTYTTLLVETDRAWEEPTLKAVRRFQSSGGNVVSIDRSASGGAGPDWSTVHLQQVDEIVSAVTQNGGRDVALQPAGPDIRVSHVMKEGRHFYLFVNEGESCYRGAVDISASGVAEWWDAWKGQIVEASTEPTAAGQRLPLTLERRQSLILHVDPERSGAKAHKVPESIGGTVRIPLLEWQVTVPTDFPVTPVGLGSWSEMPDLTDRSGTVRYTASFELERNPVEAGASFSAVLDLGIVGEIADVQVNGETAGTVQWSPYRIEIGPHLKAGRNRISVDVTNNLACRYDGLHLPSGLIGPVELQIDSNHFIRRG